MRLINPGSYISTIAEIVLTLSKQRRNCTVKSYQLNCLRGAASIQKTGRIRQTAALPTTPNINIEFVVLFASHPTGVIDSRD
jgi:hypothetical protein